MVGRVVRLMYSEVRGLHQAAYLLAIFTFASQVLALVRDRLLAHQFGAGTELDIYYAAFRIPDLLYVLFASTLSVYVLIPFVSARMHGDDASEARDLLGQVASFFLSFYFVIALVVFIIAPYLVPILVPGLAAHTTEVVMVLRVLLLQPLLLGLSSLVGVITQLQHRFALYAMSPLVYNLGIIFGILLLYPTFGLPGLAFGVVLGAFGHLAIQWPLMKTSALSFRFFGPFSLTTMRSVLLVSLPRALTLALHQLVLLALIGIASLMTVGSVSIFQFAYNLQSVPLAVIGSSYSIAAFPLLADLFAQKKLDQFRVYVTTAIRHIIFWSVPIIALVIVLRAQLVRVVLGSGAFNWSDTRLTAAVLAILSISLVAQALNLLIVRTFYAGGYTKVPFIITMVGMAATVVVTYFLYHLFTVMPRAFHPLFALFRINNVPGGEVVIVAISYTVLMISQTILMLIVAGRLFGLPLRWLWIHSLRSLAAAIVGGVMSYATLQFLAGGVRQESFTGILVQGVVAGVVGTLGIFIAYRLLRSPELAEVTKSLHSRLRGRTEVMAVQDDVL